MRVCDEVDSGKHLPQWERETEIALAAMSRGGQIRLADLERVHSTRALDSLGIRALEARIRQDSASVGNVRAWLAQGSQRRADSKRPGHLNLELLHLAADTPLKNMTGMTFAAMLTPRHRAQILSTTKRRVGR